MTIKRKNEQTLKEAIDMLLNAYGLTPKLKEVRIISEWETVVGVNVAKLTSDLKIRNHTLFVKCKSAALRNELSYRKTSIMNELNKIVEDNIIKDIVISN